MKEIFRHLDLSTVSYYGNLLESEGIPVILRNEHTTTSGITSIPIPEFYPNICVLYDEDYPKAWDILNKAMHADKERAGQEIVCPKCGEVNPANFDFCFSCEENLVFENKS
ncbi:Putative signal transducing protein [Rubritalea squalenifaciens DSM 18772]|uniref:Putative signal transducing protein n=1 Tax=Rubritalea squalenifaciens DSM 18772 TaxID=1123071 RepID=A0A1M6P0R0_9BACT|nr:DUF2007 domain-containing protein [Rubritalea squalenifaciens]SHK01516.1 Putative signal transducing protein [Rubritalea squalenifaciens DSM 18772]